MANEKKKKILLGVTGGIAAYKSAEIVRALQKRDYDVVVVMTEHATEFVAPLTFQALTGERVGLGQFDEPDDPIRHITLGQGSDLFLIAPCTANVMAKIACGIADDLLTSTALASTAPLFIAPAMNVHMYENPATQANMATLASRGVTFLDSAYGYQACGDVGKGRMAEPEDIADAVDAYFADAKPEGDLAGKRIMITAGPTQEPIDPVRYITNRSSGKFGYAIAKAAVARGADVTLISGPVALPAPEGATVRYIESANDLLAAASDVFPSCDVAIFAAAVADVRPAHYRDSKLKKATDAEALKNIELVENPDVLATMGAQKDKQIVVGFAAETNDVIENARRKLATKNANMIIANEVGTDKAFGKDENEIWFVTETGEEHVGPLPKSELADVILDKACGLS